MLSACSHLIVAATLSATNETPLEKSSCLAGARAPMETKSQANTSTTAWSSSAHAKYLRRLVKNGHYLSYTAIPADKNATSTLAAALSAAGMETEEHT